MAQDINKHNPDFIGLGAFKAGTSFIFNALKQHPEIYMSQKKEINYFNKFLGLRKPNPNFSKDVQWYQNHFSHCNNKNKKKGEISPMYLVDEEAPSRIKELYPNIKFIVCLRDPIDRAYSHFIMEQITLKTKKFASFDQALQENPIYLEASLYHKHIKKYLQYFDLSQFHFVFLNDLERDPQKELEKIYKYLNLKDLSFSPKINHQGIFRNSFYINKSQFKQNLFFALSNIMHWIWKTRISQMAFFKKIMSVIKRLLFRCQINNQEYQEYKKLDSKNRKKYLLFFLDDIEQLEKLLKIDLSSWKQ